MPIKAPRGDMGVHQLRKAVACPFDLSSKSECLGRCSCASRRKLGEVSMDVYGEGGEVEFEFNNWHVTSGLAR